MYIHSTDKLCLCLNDYLQHVFRYGRTQTRFVSLEDHAAHGEANSYGNVNIFKSTPTNAVALAVRQNLSCGAGPLGLRMDSATMIGIC